MITGRLLKRSEIDDTQWNHFIDHSPQHSIYCSSWYLDAICKQWMAIVVSNNDYWLSVMPINVDAKLSIRYSIQPIFAQFLGLLFAPFDFLPHKELDLQKKIINKTIDLLPGNLKIVSYNFNPRFEYFLPFHWRGFNITPRLSYQLILDKDMGEIASNYSSSIKNHIKKSERNKLQCVENNAIEELLELSYANNILNRANCTRFKNLWQEVILRDLGYCLYIKDGNNNTHCGGAFLKDRDKIIFLLVATKKELKKYGSTAFLINESIKRAWENPQYKFFDFEGSMIEPVEKYFRGFNPTPIIYFNIGKNKIGELMRLYQKVKMHF